MNNDRTNGGNFDRRLSEATLQYQDNIKRGINGDNLYTSKLDSVERGYAGFAPQADLYPQSFKAFLYGQVDRVSFPLEVDQSGKMSEMTRKYFYNFLKMVDKHMDTSDPYRNPLLNVEHAEEHAVFENILKAFKNSLLDGNTEYGFEFYGGDLEHDFKSNRGPYINIQLPDYMHQETRLLPVIVGELIADRYKNDFSNAKKAFKAMWEDQEFGETFTILSVLASGFDLIDFSNYMIEQKVKGATKLQSNMGYIMEFIHPILFNEEGYFEYSNAKHLKALNTLKNFVSHNGNNTSFETTNASQQLQTRYRKTTPLIAFHRLPTLIHKMKSFDPVCREGYGNYRDNTYFQYVEDNYGNYVVSTLATAFLLPVKMEKSENILFVEKTSPANVPNVLRGMII